MKRTVKFFALILILVQISVLAGDKKATNPLLQNFNEVIPFADLSTENIVEATENSILEARSSLKKLYTIPKKERTFDNTMLELDNIYDHVQNVFYSIYLMGNVHPDDEVRNQANESRSEFSKFFNEIQLDEHLYRAVKDYSLTNEAKELTGYKAKFVKETVEGFERNGFALPEEKREQLKEINDKLSDLSLKF